MSNTIWNVRDCVFVGGNPSVLEINQDTPIPIHDLKEFNLIGYKCYAPGHWPDDGVENVDR